MAEKLSSLFVEFRASTDKFNSDLKALNREVREFEKLLKPSKELLGTIGSVASTAGTALAAVGVAAAAAGATIALIAKTAADYGDAMRDASIRTGLTTQALAGLKLMAEQNGATFDDLNSGLKFLSKNFIAASDGGKEQLKAFQKLGISAKDLKDAHGDLQVVMRKVMDSLHDMPDGASKAAIQLELLGKGGIALTEMFSQGSAALEKYNELTKILGLDVTPDAASAADSFNDSLNVLERAVQGWTVSVGGKLIPALTEVVNITSAAVVTAKDYALQLVGLAQGSILAANALWGGNGSLGSAVAGVLSVIPGANLVVADIAVNYVKLAEATATASAAEVAADHLRQMFIASQQKQIELTEEQIKAKKKLEETISKASIDSLQFAIKGEAAERDLLDTHLEYATKIYEAETKAKIDELKKQIKAINDIGDVIFEAQQRSLKIAQDAEAKERSDLDRSIDYHTDIYEKGDKERKESRDKILKDIGDAEKKAAEAQQRIWEQATANITSDFVKAFSDVIFHAKNFGQAMKDIALKTAESMFQAFLTGLLTPLTTELSKLGGKLADLLSGKSSAGANSTGSSSGGGSSNSGGSSGGGSRGGIGGLFDQGSNVNGWIQAADKVREWINMIGAGRRAANEVVKSQNSVWDSIATDFNSRNKDSLVSLQQTRSRLDQQFADWQRNIDAFAASDPNNQKVANQAFATLSPQIANLRRQLDTDIAKLGGGFGVSGSGVPGTGLEASASNIFAAAVDRLVPALNTLADRIVPSGGQMVTVTNDFSPSFTFYGVTESLQKEIRDTIEPQIVSDLQDNSRGITEKIKAALGL